MTDITMIPELDEVSPKRNDEHGFGGQLKVCLMLWSLL